MSDGDGPSVEVSLSVEEGFVEGYLHGFMAAIVAHDEDDAPAPACEDCSCGVEDPLDREPELDEVAGPAALDFQKEVRDYLLRYDLIEEDDLVSQVIVCPEEVRALVERA